MLIKEADNKQESLDTLQGLLERADLSSQQKTAIKKELYIMRAGIKGEKEAAYEIGFHFDSAKNYILIHDLRLEVNGRVAQIDHLIIDRTLTAYVLETKHFGSGIKINENGEFLYWNAYKKTYEGIPSPIAQNQRHQAVLNDFFKQSETPKRLGMKLIPKIETFVLVSNNARIDRPKKFDTSKVIKCDAFMSVFDTYTKEMSAVNLFSSVGRIVSRDTLTSIGRILKYSHKPITVNYLAKFGLTEESTPNLKPQKNTVPADKETTLLSSSPTKNEATPNLNAYQCSKCNSGNVFVTHGRYGYYFKCQSCHGNTAIKLTCETAECKPRIRKKGLNFFKECAHCKSSESFFNNPEILETVDAQG